MTRITKLELEQRLIASQRDNVALREQLSVLRAQLASAAQTMQAGCEQAQANAAQQLYRAAAPRPARSLPSHFAAARELAMRTGRSVRVGA
jgi:hypothetical protein